MDDVNPFQSPTTELIDARLVKNANVYWVDRDCLVVVRGTVLPPVCVVTNQPLSEQDMLLKRFSWHPPWLVLLFFLAPLLLPFAYLILRRRCWITYGLDYRIRRKYRKRILFKVLAVFVFAAFGLLFALTLRAGHGAPGALWIALFLLIAALLSLCFGNSVLRVAKYRDGMFWIKGASRAYLASLQAPAPPRR